MFVSGVKVYEIHMLSTSSPHHLSPAAISVMYIFTHIRLLHSADFCYLSQNGVSKSRVESLSNPKYIDWYSVHVQSFITLSLPLFPQLRSLCPPGGTFSWLSCYSTEFSSKPGYLNVMIVYWGLLGCVQSIWSIGPCLDRLLLVVFKLLALYGLFMAWL